MMTSMETVLSFVLVSFALQTYAMRQVLLEEISSAAGEGDRKGERLFGSEISGYEPTKEEGADWHGSAPLCFRGIVQAQCAQFYEDGMDYVPAKRLLGERFSASDDDIDTFFDEIEADTDVRCRYLCGLTLDYAHEHGYIIPPAHDKGCVKIEGTWHCDIDVSPALIVEQAEQAKTDMDAGKLPDNGKGVNIIDPGSAITSPSVMMEGATRSVVAQHIGRAISSPSSFLAKAAEGDEPVPQNVDQLVLKTLRFFRIYVARPDDDSKIRLAEKPSSFVSVNGSTKMSPERAIATAKIQAQAWVSTVLAQMSNYRTAGYRAKWFGGSGTKSEDAIRTRILRTFNFMDRELADMNYYYPADNAAETSCGDSTLAYVWKYRSDEEGYTETRGPRCWSFDEAGSKTCAVDNDGNYIVYLCKYWYESFGEVARTSTFVHEAAHHTGPTDVSYEVSKIKSMPQADQLNNAANYQRFGEDVTLNTWGCADSDFVTGAGYTCGGGPCPCGSLKNECNDARVGHKVREQCKATCGLCVAPQMPPRNGGVTRPTRPVTPVGVCDGALKAHKGNSGSCHDVVTGAVSRESSLDIRSWFQGGIDCKCEDGWTTGGSNGACSAGRKFSSNDLQGLDCCCVKT